MRERPVRLHVLQAGARARRRHAGARTRSSVLRRWQSHSAARCMPLCASIPVSPNTCGVGRV